MDIMDYVTLFTCLFLACWWLWNQISNYSPDSYGEYRRQVRTHVQTRERDDELEDINYTGYDSGREPW